MSKHTNYNKSKKRKIVTERYREKKKVAKKEKEAKMEEKVKGLDLTNDPVFGDLFTIAQKRRDDPLKTSDVFLTINLLESFLDMELGRKELFRGFGERLFGKSQEILEYFVDESSESQDILLTLKETSMSWVAEVCPKTSFLHLHALVQLKHTGKYVFHPEILHKYAFSVFGHKLHIFSPIRSNQAENWKQYMLKCNYVL